MKLNTRELFANRHLAPSPQDVTEMLAKVGADSIATLIQETIPPKIQNTNPLNQLSPALSEDEYLAHIEGLLNKNKVFRSYIGQGYFGTIIPPVIQRNILENPGWYTAYTPYQAEISQGRMEMLINYQTMVTELTGMDLSNASLLDEATAAAEAMTMLYGARKGPKKKVACFLIDSNVYPQTLAVMETRAKAVGIDTQVVDLENESLDFSEVYGVFIQNPGQNGEVKDWTPLVQELKKAQVFTAMASDLLALVTIKTPGEMGADVVVGNSQRFGVPMGCGGPHAGFFATKDAFKRSLPGRIIGVSQDAQGNKAYRMALQTREQHIRREKATSNICTSQVLLAVMAGSYAVYHGPHGLKRISQGVHSQATYLANKLTEAQFKVKSKQFFDTIVVEVTNVEEIQGAALAAEINFHYENNLVFISLDETVTPERLQEILEIFGISQSTIPQEVESNLNILRSTPFLEHKVFQSYHSEHEMLRYLKSLENKDISMVHSMISLGSCTMKLNASAEMMPITWKQSAHLHPFAPLDQIQGTLKLIHTLEKDLAHITGFANVSLQPNSGAQGELTGLLVIKAYHESNNESHRNIALIPSSAHGTNPASAAMTSLKVVVVKCDDHGNIDIDDLDQKITEHGTHLSCLMVTYPSTHGVFELGIKDICEKIHQVGGQVYMDGANLNAQLGHTSPGAIGADVCHLNLHKTFAIPHGGGGPGVGPIGVAKHLSPFLPGHPIIKTGGQHAIGPVSAAPYGSVGVLPISYGYIKMMGGEGLTEATNFAILNANYIKDSLKDFYPVLYTGHKDRCAHEFILDCRGFKDATGIQVEDIAKRLMDFGFHAPTVSFPVVGTLMIEPTESEPKVELDRFAAAMIQIRKEIQKIEDGLWPQDDNPIMNAPHTSAVLLQEHWEHSYTRTEAAFPLDWVQKNKYWPTVARVDNAYGDRNLFCSCIPTDEL